MAKNILITEKPSVAMEFAKVLNINTSRKDGYLEADNWIITWCVGHLVTMSYPEKYDEKLKFWRLDTLPFIPEEYKYEVIPSVQKQFNTIQSLLTREDVSTIYVATDSGREGEYIYRLVEQMIGVKNKDRKRVWIDSQTEEEIKRGIREAKELDEYDSLADSAYLRAKEDYLIGINFSRLLTIIYGRRAAKELNQDKISISVGRVMTCVLGMVVSREREIRNFVKVPYYKIVGEFGNKEENKYFMYPEGNPQMAPTVGNALYDLMAENKWKGAKKWAQNANKIAPTLVGGSKKHGGPDLGPVRARNAWAELGVDGRGVANMAPEPDFEGMPRLTSRMLARIQGFPDTWTFGKKKTAACRMIGNAFPPPVAKAVGEKIKECLENECTDCERTISLSRKIV